MDIWIELRIQVYLNRSLDIASASFSEYCADNAVYCILDIYFLIFHLIYWVLGWCPSSSVRSANTGSTIYLKVIKSELSMLHVRVCVYARVRECMYGYVYMCSYMDKCIYACACMDTCIWVHGCAFIYAALAIKSCFNTACIQDVPSYTWPIRKLQSTNISIEAIVPDLHDPFSSQSQVLYFLWLYSNHFFSDV